MLMANATCKSEYTDSLPRPKKSSVKSI